MATTVDLAKIWKTPFDFPPTPKTPVWCKKICDLCQTWADL